MYGLSDEALRDVWPIQNEKKIFKYNSNLNKTSNHNKIFKQTVPEDLRANGTGRLPRDAAAGKKRKRSVHYSQKQQCKKYRRGNGKQTWWQEHTCLLKPVKNRITGD